MKKVVRGIQIAILIVLPVVYFKIYNLAAAYFQSQFRAVAYDNTLIPIIAQASLVAIFPLILLEVGRYFGAGSYLKKIFVIAILLAHIIFSYFESTIVMYYMYIEVVASFLLVIFVMIVECFLDLYKKNPKH